MEAILAAYQNITARQYVKERGQTTTAVEKWKPNRITLFIVPATGESTHACVPGIIVYSDSKQIPGTIIVLPGTR